MAAKLDAIVTGLPVRAVAPAEREERQMRELLVQRGFDPSGPPVARLVILDESAFGADDVIVFGAEVHVGAVEEGTVVMAAVVRAVDVDGRSWRERYAPPPAEH